MMRRLPRSHPRSSMPDGFLVGDPAKSKAIISAPSSTQTQYEKIQGLIQTGIDEGAPPWPPAVPAGRRAWTKGYYVRPTVFGNVSNQMEHRQRRSLARSWSSSLTRTRPTPSASPTTRLMGWVPMCRPRDLDHARAIAARLRAGTVGPNYPAWDVRAPSAASSNPKRSRIRRLRNRRLSRMEGGRRLDLSERPADALPSSHYPFGRNPGGSMFSLDDLANLIDRRAGASAEASYTRSLLDKGATAPASSARRR